MSWHFDIFGPVPILGFGIGWRLDWTSLTNIGFQIVTYYAIRKWKRSSGCAAIVVGVGWLLLNLESGWRHQYEIKNFNEFFDIGEIFTAWVAFWLLKLKAYGAMLMQQADDA